MNRFDKHSLQLGLLVFDLERVSIYCMKKLSYLIVLAISFSSMSQIHAVKPGSVGKPSKAETPAIEKKEPAAGRGQGQIGGDARKQDTPEDVVRGEKSNKSDKTNAQHKEAGKGSEVGQQKREEHRRKWWKFWE